MGTVANKSILLASLVAMLHPAMATAFGFEPTGIGYGNYLVTCNVVLFSLYGYLEGASVLSTS